MKIASQILEELVINLTSSEKSTFIRFLGLYLGSSFILMILIAFFYFQNEKTLYVDLVKSNIQNIASKASNEIIMAHMMGYEFDKSKYTNKDMYKISFYDKKENKLFGNLDKKINFDEKYIINNDEIILIDNSTVGHLGIEYIAIEDNSLKSAINDLKSSIALIFILFFSFISLVGFYLAKLFLKPIKDERNRLNNFIKDTTHELNTPISAIMMSSESSNLSEKQIERIRLSAKRVSEIYKDLTYIFLEDTKTLKNSENYNLKELIEEQLQYFEPLANKKRVTINLKLKDFSYKINKEDFERLFNNLLSNAIKYNKISGKIEISLDSTGNFSISDSGIGIEQNRLNDIFKRYFRATSEQGGFGLGLNIVNLICKKQNISIDVKSTLNVGTTFSLKF